jgi:3-dehydroquinate synthase
MIIATVLSYKLGYLPLKDCNNIKNHFNLYNLPMSDKNMFNEKIFKIIEKDKKNDNKKINFVLIKKIGSAFLSNNLNLNKIKKTLK